ncbi:autotransporter domain-containing protein [Pseudomonas viciae]|uniref:Autotransporter outer membrane beta-barrel domain-containing protein n=1 Tax=Pseudomonas viciae TaxID=2505979 RepID=A0ABY8P7G3_9PSED|nr:autotransporter outer membrane beta-barrel domain-containing protein [Pseudomonas viciae]UZE84163.1 autotransporter outer membrane beta-barrel domain-containing protein [Pseudomonas viciae]WGO91075.1 autotransporter outer membrane beta-barrel domain-containing protein [Pseudomonas viciae]
MKTSLRPQEITTTFYTVSTSLLLLSSMEVQAWPVEETSQPWYGRTSQDSQNAAVSGTDVASNKSPALFTLRNDSGHTQRMGLISGQNQIISNAGGVLVTPAMAEPGKDALNLQGPNLGAYWSLTGPTGWHVDLSASGGRVNGYGRTEQGQRQAAEGNAVTLSVEGGFPIGISTHWVVEPQAQLINQRVTLETPNAESGTRNELNTWSGRVGARLKGNYQVNGLGVEPYVRTNLWHTVQNNDTLTLDKVDKISSSRKSSTVEVGLGLVARVTPLVSLYVSADYSSDVDDNDLNGIITSMGVRMRW